MITFSKGIMPMRPIIEFCVNNYQHGIEPLVKKLESNLDYDVIEYGCLGNCGECYANPYALVNGEIVSASSADELDANISLKIKAIEDMYKLFDE
jgi:uncharacterized protein YuzB (UPF0349 family)